MSAVSAMADPRVDARSNVFLAAVLLADGQQLTVRIRNISRGGALLDGTGFPAEGASVQLVRGSLTVRGAIAWKDAVHCGVRFATAVVVEDWIRRVGHDGQQRVDDMISLVRQPAAVNIAASLLVREPDSLKSISAELAEVCERLASVPEIVAKQADELLRLDAIAQRLGCLAAKAENRE